MAKSITIKDIAREAGVSIALVSFVMNNRTEANGKQKYRVSSTTRDRILEVARRYNYQPSSAARMLRQGRTHVIGVILSDLSNIFYGIIARELENQAALHGYTVLFGSSDEDPRKFDLLLRSFIEKDVEGFIVVPCEGSRSSLEYLIRSGRPFVVIDRYHPDYRLPTVLTDNADAMRQAVDYLRSQGARSIEMVSYAMRISSMGDRETAFREILGADAHIYHLPFNLKASDASAVADEVIRKGTDALIMSSNVPSVAVLQQLFRRGVRIQKDIKVVSFDYSNAYAFFDPPIPYILQPLPQITEAAAAYLFRLIEAHSNGESPEAAKKIVFKSKLIV